MTLQLNVIFFGSFPYPQGMAGTKRIQHAIDGLKREQNVFLRVLTLTQSSEKNILNGTHEEVPYETIVGDVRGWKLGAILPMLILKSQNALRRAYRPDCKNIIYNYGPLNLFNTGALITAKNMGYSIVFDIVEDYDESMDISGSILHRIKTFFIQKLQFRMESFASGIIVISSHLEKKYRNLVNEQVPIHYRPISVNLSKFSKKPHQFGDFVKLFYAGSFGKKDGVSVLMDAFDILASRHTNICLVLTGKGSKEMIQATFERINASPYKKRIEYKGYLDDDAYYDALSAADIPCMTRIDSAYAQAGFPFKVGEYLASGKPSILSQVSDIEKILKDQREALLVKPGDVNAIVQATEKLLNNQDVATAIGSEGREAANRLFNYKEQGKKLLNFFKRI